jgi:hypothetical protein
VVGPVPPIPRMSSWLCPSLLVISTGTTLYLYFLYIEEMAVKSSTMIKRLSLHSLFFPMNVSGDFALYNPAVLFTTARSYCQLSDSVLFTVTSRPSISVTDSVTLISFKSSFLVKEDGTLKGNYLQLCEV